MGFFIGLVVGALAGIFAGGEMARRKRMRQIGAAQREGRVKIEAGDGQPIAPEDLNYLLDDEYRDA